MSVKIRMNRVGRTNRPCYRIGAYYSRNARNGRCLEVLGSYDPIAPEDKQVKINLERVKYWISVGAQPSPKAKPVLRKGGFVFQATPKKTEKK